MTGSVNVLSSMATRPILSSLSTTVSECLGVAVRVRSMGGVDATRAVRRGEGGDLVVLPERALAELKADGHLIAGTMAPLFRSYVAVAAAPGRPPPKVETVDDLRQALREASRIAYSTGPSGVAVQALLRQWDMWSEVGNKLVQARSGVPVASLLLAGRADIGFQQLSEFLDVAGIHLLGLMPPGSEIETVFSGAVLVNCQHAMIAQSVLKAFATVDSQPIVRRGGMEVATSPTGSSTQKRR